MPRVKGGYVARRRRKRVLKLAKGYYGSKHALYRTAHEQVMRSLQYSYRDRKVRKRDFRKLWIERINAACRLNGMKYSQFIYGLSQKDVIINRKMLADLAVNDANAFADLVAVAKEGIANPKPKTVVETVFVKPAPKAERTANHAKEANSPKKVEEVKVETKKAVKTETPKVETKKAPTPKVEAKKVEKTVKVEETPKTTSKLDYNAMTLVDLKSLCKERGIKGYSTLKKAEIIELLNK